jgi:ribosome-interacting GTPase 1
MPLPASELWRRIRQEITGQPESRQIEILHRHLADWPMDFKGPYQVLRSKLLDTLADLERTETIRRGGGHPDAFYVKRSGAAQIALAGVTNSGKSSLVAALTAATAQIGEYPFTTQVPVPGMMEVGGTSIQLIDTPSVVEGLAQGEGPGRPLLQLFRVADGLGFVVDLTRDPLLQMKVLLGELRAGSIEAYPGRLPIVIRPKGRGRVEIRSALELDRESEELVRRALREADIHAAQVWVRGAFGAEDLVLQLEAGACVPALIVGTKNDEPAAHEGFARLCAAYPHYPAIDVNFLDETHFPELRDMLFELSGLMRVCCAGEDGTLEGAPVPMPLGATVADLAETIDRRLAEALTGARIWGPSAQFTGQMVGPEHTLAEGDAVLLRTR